MSFLKIMIVVILLINFYLGSAAPAQELPAQELPAQALPSPTSKDTAATPEKTTPAPVEGQLGIFKEGWQFVVAPYMWIPGMHLNISPVGSGRGSVKATLPWYEVVPKLFSSAMGGMGQVEIWYNGWGLFSDTNFMYLSESASKSGGKTFNLNISKVPVTIPVRLDLSGSMTVWSRVLWQDVGIRRLVGVIPLGEAQQPPAISFELFGGLRYTYINQNVKLGVAATLSGPQGNVVISRGGVFYGPSEVSIFEPLVGFRVGCWFNPKWNLLLKADCGGFGLVNYNSVDTVLEALVGYQVHKNARIYAGYRGRYASASGDKMAVRGWFHGPMLGTAFRF